MSATSVVIYLKMSGFQKKLFFQMNASQFRNCLAFFFLNSRYYVIHESLIHDLSNKESTTLCCSLRQNDFEKIWFLRLMTQ